MSRPSSSHHASFNLKVKLMSYLTCGRVASMGGVRRGWIRGEIMKE